jgi:hypothetical protein
MAGLRATLNEVVLDPACATRIAEQAMNPSSAADGDKKERQTPGGAAGWIAPLTKLFGGASAEPSPAAEEPTAAQAMRRAQSRGAMRAPMPTRIAPKLGPERSQAHGKTMRGRKRSREGVER